MPHATVQNQWASKKTGPGHTSRKVHRMRLEWFPAALHDFDEIIDFIAEDNPVAAIEQGDEIETQVEGLLDNHHQGRSERV